MYLHHPGGFYYTYFIYSITQQFHRFYGLLPWEQGLVLGAFCHTSPAEENRDRNISILSISSRSSGTRTNRVRNSPRRTHRDDGTVTFYTLCAVDQSLIVHSLKGEATLPGSSQCQLEVCQSAVAKPPFERGFEAQLSSHHPLFLSPNSRVTVMSYQDRVIFYPKT